MRPLPLLLGALLLTAASAQPPLAPPVYYLSTAPRLVEDRPLQGELGPGDGQNFKDGAYVDVYTFAGEAGERLELTVRSDALDPFLSVYAPDGRLLGANDDDAGRATTDAHLELVLPAAGRYLAVVSGFGALDTGPYEIVRRGPARALAGRRPAKALELPARLDAVLSASAEPAVDYGGPADLYAFELAEPLLLIADLSSLDFDAVLTLFGPGGEVVAEADDSFTGTDARLQVELQPGRYELAAAAFSPEGAGPYHLEVALYRPLE